MCDNIGQGPAKFAHFKHYILPNISVTLQQIRVFRFLLTKLKMFKSALVVLACVLLGASGTVVPGRCPVVQVMDKFNLSQVRGDVSNTWMPALNVIIIFSQPACGTKSRATSRSSS